MRVPTDCGRAARFGVATLGCARQHGGSYRAALPQRDLGGEPVAEADQMRSVAVVPWRLLTFEEVTCEAATDRLA